MKKINKLRLIAVLISSSILVISLLFILFKNKDLIKLTSKDIFAQAGTIWNIERDATDSKLKFYTGTDITKSKLTIATDGKVGIGTISPSTTLDVAGTGNFTNTLNVAKTSSVNENAYAGVFSLTDSSTVETTTKTKYPMYVSYTKSGNGTYTSWQPGTIASYSNLNAGTLNYYWGITNRTSVGGSTINNYIADFVSDIQYSSGGTVPDKRAFYVRNWNHAVTNQYGLYVDNLTSGTAGNYAVYTDGSSSSYFGGNVGIGTTSPDELLTLKAASTIKIKDPSDSTWGTILSNDSSGNGTLVTHGHDLQIYSGYDKTLTLGHINNNTYGGKVVFPGGNVGIGTTNPSGILEVKQSYMAFGVGGYTDIWWESLDNDGIWFTFRNANPLGATYFRSDPDDSPQNGNEKTILTLRNDGSVGINTSNPGSYKLYVNGSIFYTGGGLNGSDIRLKKNIEKIDNVLEKLDSINGVKFDWRTNEFPEKNLPKGRQIGVIAQDVEKQFPELVGVDNEGYKAVDYDKMVPVLLEAIKELKQEINELKKAK